MPHKLSTGLIFFAAFALHLIPTPFFTPAAVAQQLSIQTSIQPSEQAPPEAVLPSTSQAVVRAVVPQSTRETQKKATLQPERKEGLAYIAIIIDDIGHHRVRGEQVINIPANLTYAVIPNTTHGDRLARYAHQAGKEVMIHLPMENTDQKPMEELALSAELSEQAFHNVFEVAIKAVPFASGLNNHMGSALTAQPLAMRWLMESVKEHQLFFVDSRTTPRSVAAEVAQQQNVLSASRDIFLDNERTTHAIDRQFRKLLVMAKNRKTAIAIGHPYPETITYLEQVVPLLAANSIRILRVSELIKYRIASSQLASAEAGSILSQ